MTKRDVAVIAIRLLSLYLGVEYLYNLSASVSSAIEAGKSPATHAVTIGTDGLFICVAVLIWTQGEFLAHAMLSGRSGVVVAPLSASANDSWLPEEVLDVAIAIVGLVIVGIYAFPRLVGDGLILWSWDEDWGKTHSHYLYVIGLMTATAQLVLGLWLMRKAGKITDWLNAVRGHDEEDSEP